MKLHEYKKDAIKLMTIKRPYLDNYKLKTRFFAQFIYIEAFIDNKWHEIARYNYKNKTLVEL